MTSLGLAEHLHTVHHPGDEAGETPGLQAERSVAIEDLNILEQVVVAVGSLPAFLVGVIYGGFVPLSTYLLSHH